MKNEIFDTIVENMISELKELFNEVEWVRIEYGVKLIVIDRDFKVETIVIYNSKKLINLVYNTKNTYLCEVLPELLAKYQKVLSVEEGEYIGIDESGKGDYFGPLVVAGFVGNQDVEIELIKLGVKDCKLLKDKKVIELSEILRQRYPSRCTSVPIEPYYYNKSMTSLKLQGKNMTALIERSQQEVIGRLVERNAEVKSILADAISGLEYYTDNKVIKGRKIPFKQVVNAERNPAVSAEGILARATFLKWLEEESKQYEIELFKGANSRVIQAAIEFIDKYSKEELKKIAKVHFKTTQKIMSICNSRM